MTTTLREDLDRAVADVRRELGDVRPEVGLILGSGLGSFADRLTERAAVPFERIFGFPRSTIVGHSGKLVRGRAGVEVLAMQGRVHFYEGHELAQVAFPARVLIACGARILILTNAAGGVDDTLTPGEIVIVRDHLNLLGGSPLRGKNDDSIGPRFPDMTHVYDPKLRNLAARVGSELGMKLREGVYAGLPGPTYETPAEVRMLRTLGADLTGMSTVPEATVARHMGARVLALSCVTNLAAGLSQTPLSHDEVTETAARVRSQFERLLGGILDKLAHKEA